MKKVVKNYKELIALKDFEGDIILDLAEDIDELSMKFKGILYFKQGTIRSVYDSATIGSVYDSVIICHVYDSATVGIFSSGVKIKKGNDNCVLLCRDCNPKIESVDKYVSVLNLTTHKTKFTLKKFIDIFDCENGKNFVMLYKSVRGDNTDSHTGKIKYEIGKKTICPDWQKDYSEECGKGLHLCPHPEMTQEYHQGKILKCKVMKKTLKFIQTHQ